MAHGVDIEQGTPVNQQGQNKLPGADDSFVTAVCDSQPFGIFFLELDNTTGHRTRQSPPSSSTRLSSSSALPRALATVSQVILDSKMAGQPPPDDDDDYYTSNPHHHHHHQPNPMLDSTTTTTTPSTSTDPPPPLPATLDSPTPAEDLALQSWLFRNRAYITTIPWHRYPSLPVLSYLWGYNDADFRHECLSSLMFYTRSAGRRLSDRERDALLEPVTRLAVAASYDRPLALGLGAWLVARSWAKSGAREAFRRAAEGAATAAAAAASSPAGAGAGAMGMGMGVGTGTVGADGHITHFSTPQQQPQHIHHQQGTSTIGRFAPWQGSGGASRVFGTLFRRTARASVPAFLCLTGYHTLWETYRVYLGENEIDSIREDHRLEEMVGQMDTNMASRVGDLEELLRRRG